LQVEVSSNGTSFQTLSPRQQFTSTVFSQLAGAVSGTGQSSFGTTTPFSNTIVSIEATSTRSTLLGLRGRLNQIASLFRVENSASTHLFSINSTGGLFASSTLLVSASGGASPFIVNSSGDVGVGTASPSRRFSVFNSNSVPQLRVSQGASTYAEFYIDSAGDVQISSTGGNVRMQNENLWVCSGGSCGATTPAGQGNLILENSVILNNNFKLQQIDASTTRMLDSTGSTIFEFDEAQQ